MVKLLGETHPFIDILSNPWLASTVPLSVFGEYYGAGYKSLLAAHGTAVTSSANMTPQASVMHVYCDSPSNRGAKVSAMQCVNKEMVANIGCQYWVPILGFVGAGLHKFLQNIFTSQVVHR